MAKFEYIEITGPPLRFTRLLNKHGSQGYRLVSGPTAGDGIRLHGIMEREVIDKPIEVKRAKVPDVIFV